LADCDFNLAALHPADPIKCRTSTQRTQAPESVDIRKRLPPLTPVARFAQSAVVHRRCAKWVKRPQVALRAKSPALFSSFLLAENGDSERSSCYSDSAKGARWPKPANLQRSWRRRRRPPCKGRWSGLSGPCVGSRPRRRLSRFRGWAGGLRRRAGMTSSIAG